MHRWIIFKDMSAGILSNNAQLDWNSHYYYYYLIIILLFIINLRATFTLSTTLAKQQEQALSMAVLHRPSGTQTKHTTILKQQQRCSGHKSDKMSVQPF